MAVCILLALGCALLPYPGLQVAAGWGAVGIGGGMGFILLLLRIKKQIRDAGTTWFLWWIGTCIRLGFVLRMDYTDMQHDVWSFVSDGGHARYILYLFQEHHLPDFDVRSVWQFYHPPLHHLLCAGWMHLMTVLGLEDLPLYESIQLVPFVWSSTALMVFVQILREFGLKQRALVLPAAIMALHPTFIYLSGALNNDILSILLMLTALLFTIKWYKNPTLWNIIPLALAIGLGMMAKLSAWLAAPAAAAVFIAVFIKHIKKPLPYLEQYGVFLLFCVPTALWWEIRNYIRWGVPITYIPMLSMESEQYVGDHPTLERLFDFSPFQFSYIYDCFTMYGQDYNEYNPLIGLMKTAVFDEYVNTYHTKHVAGFGEVLFWSQVVLAALVLFCMIRFLVHRGTMKPSMKIGLLLTYIITLGSYYSFCFTFPHTCTQSARYATPALYVSLLFLGLWSMEMKGKPAAVLRWCITGVAGVFMAASLAVYGFMMFV